MKVLRFPSKACQRDSQGEHANWTKSSGNQTERPVFHPQTLSIFRLLRARLSAAAPLLHIWNNYVRRDGTRRKQCMMGIKLYVGVGVTAELQEMEGEMKDGGMKRKEECGWK